MVLENASLVKANDEATKDSSSSRANFSKGSKMKKCHFLRESFFCPCIEAARASAERKCGICMLFRKLSIISLSCNPKFD